MQSTAQQEALRQQYLQAIGITTWLPTQALPGSANQVHWRWQSDDAVASADTGLAVPDVQAANNQASHSATAASPASSRARDLLAQMGGDAEPSPQKPATPQVGTSNPETSYPQASALQAKTDTDTQTVTARVQRAKTAEQTSASTPPPRFRLLLAAYADCLLACDMPQQRQSQGADADRLYHLLANILKSIGLGQGEAHFHQFDWPFINSPHIDQGTDVARQGLADVIGRMPGSAAVPLLVFGEQATHYVLPAGSQAEEKPWQLGTRWCLAAPSLHELMGVPGLKRELWQQLQYLQRQLDDGRD